jgi:hypothetical protein
MKLYLDEDSAAKLLVQLLRKAGHDVQLPRDVGLSGKDDPIQLRQAIRAGRVCLTQNHHHFQALHELIMEAQGHHPGIFIVRKDNNPKRDLSEHDIVRAIGKLLASGLPLADHLHILNQWR